MTIFTAVDACSDPHASVLLLGQPVPVHHHRSQLASGVGGGGVGGGHHLAGIRRIGTSVVESRW